MTIERTIEVLEEWKDLLTNVASKEFSDAYDEAIENCRRLKHIEDYMEGLEK